MHGERPAARKRKRGIRTYGRILECAAEVFASRGCERATLGEIASAAGIRESSIYSHFGGKAEILRRLFEVFREESPGTRPPEKDLERMLDVLTPSEVMKGILLYYGTHAPRMMEHIELVLESERCHNPEADAAYRDCVVREPADYYEKLFRRMAERGMIAPIDARLFAEQYNYASMELSRQYFLAKPGMKERADAVREMLKSIGFFCDLMAKRP